MPSPRAFPSPSRGRPPLEWRPPERVLPPVPPALQRMEWALQHAAHSCGADSHHSHRDSPSTSPRSPRVCTLPTAEFVGTANVCTSSAEDAWRAALTERDTSRGGLRLRVRLAVPAPVKLRVCALRARARHRARSSPAARGLALIPALALRAPTLLARRVRASASSACIKAANISAFRPGPHRGRMVIGGSTCSKREDHPCHAVSAIWL